MEKIKHEICKLLEKFTEGEINAENQLKEDRIIKECIDSIIYIELIVEMEERYNFEFDDDKLDISVFESITDLANYIAMKGDIKDE